jgi:CRISPR system Cascade subunit CasE
MNLLYLMHCLPDPHRLTVWAARHGLLGPEDDLGYALHGLLSAAFGEHAPKPFSYRDTRAGLLAYTRLPAAELAELSSLASPDVAAALGLDAGPVSPGLNARPFPQSWRVGQELGFSVRVRPVQRAMDGRERDVFLAAADRAGADTAVLRETVYRQWLEQQLAAHGAARLLDARMTGFSLTNLMLRTQRTQDAEGGRTKRFVCGPDVTFEGRLRVEDPVAFAGQVARGIGRYRAFGFGMLLLRPSAGAR